MQIDKIKRTSTVGADVMKELAYYDTKTKNHSYYIATCRTDEYDRDVVTPIHTFFAKP